MKNRIAKALASFLIFKAQFTDIFENEVLTISFIEDLLNNALLEAEAQEEFAGMGEEEIAQINEQKQLQLQKFVDAEIERMQQEARELADEIENSRNLRMAREADTSDARMTVEVEADEFEEELELDTSDARMTIEVVGKKEKPAKK